MVLHLSKCCRRCTRRTTSFLPPPQRLQDGVRLPVFPPTILAVVQVLLIRSSSVPAVVDTVGVVIVKAVVFVAVLLLGIAVVVLLPRHVVIVFWTIQIVIVLLPNKATLGIVVATAVVVAMAVMMAMAMAMTVPLVKTVPPINLYFVRIESFFRWSPT
jgi:hypothetical protein